MESYLFPSNIDQVPSINPSADVFVFVFVEISTSIIKTG